MPQDDLFQNFAQPGTRVRYRHDAGLMGETTGRTRGEDDELMVQVRFPGEPPRFELAEDLELAEEALDDRDQVLGGRFASARHLRKRLTSVQLAGQLSEMIYSLDTTDTQFMPHQFKPLLALLESPSKGLLIADEVGLGKTIEAGLIWTELRVRSNATRMLVVCPAMLTEKWKHELYRRFGTPGRVMSAAELLDHLRQGEAAPRIPAIICSVQGLRPPTDALESDSEARSPVARLAQFLDAAAGEVLFDLVVIDEAHYLRNRETSSALLGRLLRPVADHFLLLSATPVNNRSTDLFNLVSLVDPDQFRYESQFEYMLSANRPLVRMANQLKRPEATAGMMLETLDELDLHWLFRDSESLKLLREELNRRDADKAFSPEERVALGHQLGRVNLLGQVVVRSRKREVMENRVERKVRNIAVPMTAVEEEFYERVTGAVIAYAQAHEGVRGFLLATPQRLMSSCMHAAATRWFHADNEVEGGNRRDLESMAWEALGEDAESVELGQVSRFVARALHGHVDPQVLRNHDSKFLELKALLQRYFLEHPKDKVIVFSYFRGTLRYLAERLEEAGIPALVVMGGDDKQAQIEKFSASDQLRVLLASEVAAEGVDLQFMRFLVNYDLPWNPMRIEQRIGRIDRIGQQAQAISIVNFVYEDTIDDRILTRLFEKLRLFEDALGCTEEVLQDGVPLLIRDLLSAELTPEQQEQRIDQTRAALEENRRQMAEIEAHEAEFLGLGEFVRNRVLHARSTQRRITSEDLQWHIREYLEEHAPGYFMRMDPGGMTGILQLGANAAARLTQFREHHRLPASKLEGNGEVPVVIRNHVKQGDYPQRYELINQHHPLVHMIAADEGRAQLGELVVAAEVERQVLGLDVIAADYAFAAEVWQFEGAKRARMVRATFLPIGAGEAVRGEASFDLLNALRCHAEDWVHVGSQLSDRRTAAELLEDAKVDLTRQFTGEKKRYLAENADRINIQRQNAIRNLERRVQRLEQSIMERGGSNEKEETKRKRYRQMTEGKIRKLRAEHDLVIEKLEMRANPKLSRSGLIGGFVRIRG